MNITHLNKNYQDKLKLNPKGKYNGAYYYSVEIVKNMIPLIKTDRPFVTININKCYNHAIFFIHSNVNLEKTYSWLHKYKDLVLVCGLPETQLKIASMFPEHKSIYLPLSIDVNEVKQYYKPMNQKPYDTCYAGRVGKFNIDDPLAMFKVKMITNCERNELLEEMSKYKKVYAVGRVALEAQVVGSEVLNYDKRFDKNIKWQVYDNREMANVLNNLIGLIDYDK